MGYKYTGDSILGVSLNVDTPKPLDIRSVVLTKEDLYNIPAKSAYEGMLVANLEDGNLYMLIDKLNLDNKSGWRASYESIQITACSKKEYDEWLANTDSESNPIDPTQTYIRKDTYYYIYEEDNQQYYVTRAQIEEWLNTRASAVELEGLRQVVNEHIEDKNNLKTSFNQFKTTVENEYIKEQTVKDTYSTKEEVSEQFENYLPKEEIENTYVTKESLRGDIEDGEDDFIFVTQKQYNQDKSDQANEFTTKQLNVENIVSENLKVNNKDIAYSEDVPVLNTISNEEYNSLKEQNKLDENTYYYTYDDETTGYITEKRATEMFYSKSEVFTSQQVRDLLKDLQDQIDELKGLSQ